MSIEEMMGNGNVEKGRTTETWKHRGASDVACKAEEHTLRSMVYQNTPVTQTQALEGGAEGLFLTQLTHCFHTLLLKSCKHAAELVTAQPTAGEAHEQKTKQKDT